MTEIQAAVCAPAGIQGGHQPLSTPAGNCEIKGASIVDGMARSGH
jgi:hypothetical protein